MTKTMYSRGLFGALLGWSALVAVLTTVAQGEETAILRLKLVYDGDVPVPKAIDGSRDPFCATLELVEDRLIVSKDGGIRDVALMYDEKKSEAKPTATATEPPESVHQLRITNCLFEPKVLVARPGQPIEVSNNDDTGHAFQFASLDSFAAPVEILTPQGKSKRIQIESGIEGPAVISVSCFVHSWMKAYLIVLEHPYVGLSDESGLIEIKDLPVGIVAFRIWHGEARRGIDQVTVAGKTQRWERGRVELTLKAGVNDLGVVKLAPEIFNP